MGYRIIIATLLIAMISACANSGTGHVADDCKRTEETEKCAEAVVWDGLQLIEYILIFAR